MLPCRKAVGLFACLLLLSPYARAQDAAFSAVPTRARDTLTIGATAGGGVTVGHGFPRSGVVVFGADAVYHGHRDFMLAATSSPMSSALTSGHDEVFLATSVTGAFERRHGFVGGGLGTLRWSGLQYQGDSGALIRMTTFTAFVDAGLGSLDGALLRASLGGRLATTRIQSDPGFLMAGAEAQLPVPFGPKVRLLVRYRFDGGWGAPFFFVHTVETRLLFTMGGRIDRLGPTLRYVRIDPPFGDVINAIEAGLSLRLGTRRTAPSAPRE